MKNLLTAIILSASTPALAGDLSVEVGVFTSHLSTEGYYEDSEYHEINNDNNFLGLSYYKDRLGVEVSSFTNSYNTQSYSIGAGYKVFKHKYLEVGLSAGVIHGYEEWQVGDFNIGGKWSVFAAPFVTLQVPVKGFAHVKL